MPPEQVFILPRPAQKPLKKNAYELIMVPTGVTGVSLLKRQYPQIISLNWPDKKADKHFTGKVGSAADQKTDTYLSVLKRVLNAQLTGFGKTVIDNSQDVVLSCAATLSKANNTEMSKAVDGTAIRYL